MTICVSFRLTYLSVYVLLDAVQITSFRRYGSLLWNVNILIDFIYTCINIGMYIICMHKHTYIHFCIRMEVSLL